MTDHNGEYSSPIKFPCDFVVKVVGKNSAGFKESIFSVFRRHFPTVNLDNVTERLSKDSTYLGLTITVPAENKAQLDKLYQELTGTPDVLMAL